MKKFILLAALSIMSLNLSGCGGVFEKARLEGINTCIHQGGNYWVCHRTNGTRGHL